DGVGARDLDVLFPVARCTSGTYPLISEAAGTDDWRIAHTAGNFPGQAAGGGTAGHFSLFVQSGAMDRAGRRKNDVADCFHAKLGGNSDLGSNFLHPIDAKLPILRWRRSVNALAPVGA